MDNCMNNGWQAAVVDWDRAIDTYRNCGELDIADAVINRNEKTLPDGDLCWIVCVTVEDFILKKKASS